MIYPESTMSQQIAEAASAFQRRVTGHAPKEVSVVLAKDTLVITMHEALTPVERALAKTPAGAAQVQEFHRLLFATSSDWLRDEIRRITGTDVLDAAAEIEPVTGSVVHAFTTGTVVQVFHLGKRLTIDFPAITPMPMHLEDTDNEIVTSKP